VIRLKHLITESYINGISDSVILAATIIGEAGGEGTDGMHAVKNVLVNRAKQKSSSAAGEALRPKQFSMWNVATSGVNTRSDYKKQDILDVIDKYTGHSKWDEAMRIANTSIKDITNGANMYYASGGANAISPPSWTRTWTQTVVIGNHTFGILK
jgi:N-acetylmuramoyl-L-alanine amidase